MRRDFALFLICLSFLEARAFAEGFNLLGFLNNRKPLVGCESLYAKAVRALDVELQFNRESTSEQGRVRHERFVQLQKTQTLLCDARSILSSQNYCSNDRRGTVLKAFEEQVKAELAHIGFTEVGQYEIPDLIVEANRYRIFCPSADDLPEDLSKLENYVFDHLRANLEKKRSALSPVETAGPDTTCPSVSK